MTLFVDLMSAAVGGVSLHNLLQVGVNRLAAGVNKVAADVESGNVKGLVHDAAGVVDFVQTHDPALAKAVEAKYDAVKASAEAEIVKARHAAAEELRKLAESVEKATGVVPDASASAAPQAPVQG
jgi:hypothetical protein